MGKVTFGFNGLQRKTQIWVAKSKKTSAADRHPHQNWFATTEFVLVLWCSHCEKCNTGNHLLPGTALRVDQVNRPEADVVVFEKVFNHRDGD